MIHFWEFSKSKGEGNGNDHHTHIHDKENKIMKYKLLIIWITGDKEEYFYKTREEAEEIRQGYYKAFGNQIAFTCIQ